MSTAAAPGDAASHGPGVSAAAAPGDDAPHGPLVVLVGAVARNGVIGRDGDLVFRDPADLRHLRAATLGHPVLMGRRTWDSLPPRFRPLPGRANWVLSRDAAAARDGTHVSPSVDEPRAVSSFDGARVFASFDAALAAARGLPRLSVIGGAEVYALALPHADELWLTEVDADLDGDVHFPAWPRAAFDEVERAPQRSDDGVRFDFVRYRRRRADAQAPPPATRSAADDGR